MEFTLSYLKRLSLFLIYHNSQAPMLPRRPSSSHKQRTNTKFSGLLNHRNVINPIQSNLQQIIQTRFPFFVHVDRIALIIS
jgi:hypothetical protein